MKQWEMWFADFPFDDDASIEKKRPVIILNVDPIEVLSVKVTSHNIRDNDEYDTPIIKWKEAGLDRPSVARISKTRNLTIDKFSHKFGNLHNDDRKNIMQKFAEFINNNV